MTTYINAEIIRAALRRRGVWLVDLRGNATEFWHKTCAGIWLRYPV